MTDRLTAIKARCEKAMEQGWHAGPRDMDSTTRLIREDLPWAVSRLDQLQQDVQRVLFMVDDDSADPLRMFRLLQAALDRSRETGA